MSTHNVRADIADGGELRLSTVDDSRLDDGVVEWGAHYKVVPSTSTEIRNLPVPHSVGLRLEVSLDMANGDTLTFQAPGATTLDGTNTKWVYTGHTGVGYVVFESFDNAGVLEWRIVASDGDGALAA